MRWRNARNAALMLGGALVCVQTLVTVLECNARPASVDPAFYAEVQQAQQSSMTARTFEVRYRTPGIVPSVTSPSGAGPSGLAPANPTRTP
jgi:hypothetical protein